jgi:EAL domain-containing protein (putative c-di-GMP-specific phosphodiesterase class I)
MGCYSAGLDRAAEDFFLRQEFQLDYQPVLSLDQQRIGGFEALLHLRQAGRSHSPVDFIPLIEETSLRAPLARWILNEACYQVRHWQAQNPAQAISVSVNLSARQLRQDDLLHRQLETTLSETGLHPGNLQLEVPEVAIHNFQAIADTLAALKGLGVQLYIDNFTPNPHTLEMLSQLPIDAVKICPRDLNSLDKVLENLENTIHFADDLGVQVIAKRIETSVELDTLKSCGFRYGQGFLFAKAITSREATALVADSLPLVEFNLATHMVTMNKLSHYLQHYLGRMIVKYWRETRPNKTWLMSLTPLATGDIVMADPQPASIDLLQQQDLRQWIQQFLGHCRRIFPHLSTMLAASPLTPQERHLLGLQGEG